MAEAKIKRFPQESVILKEGELNTDMYKILKGHAELYVGYGTPVESLLGILGPGSCFGEFGLLLKKPSIYTVIAYDDVAALRISEGEMGDFVRENHAYIIEIMRQMAGNMMSMRLQIELLLKELEAGKTPDREDLKERIRQARHTMRAYSLLKPSSD